MRLSLPSSSFAFAASLWSAATHASASAQNVDAVDIDTSSNFLRRPHNAVAADYESAALSVDDGASNLRDLASGSGSKRSKSTSSQDVTASLAFTMTNDDNANEIVVYSRDAQTGLLNQTTTKSTGGKGGILPSVANDPTRGPDDPLASQDSLVVSGKCLLAVNAGSDTVSSFLIEENAGVLRLSNVTSIVPSGGIFPVTIAAPKASSVPYSGHSSGSGSKGSKSKSGTNHGNFVYVGHAGGPAPDDIVNNSSNPNVNGGSVVGFALDDYTCALERIDKSFITLGQGVYFPTRVTNYQLELLPPSNNTVLPFFANNTVLPFFAASLAQISFTPDGKEVIAVLKAAENDQVSPGVIIRFEVNSDGTLTELSRVNSSVAAGGNSSTPFSFAFDDYGNMLLTEAFGGADVPPVTPNGDDAGRVRSYRLEDNGDLTPLDFVDTGKSTTCWIRYNPTNGCAYTTDNAADATSAIGVGKNGELTLEEGVQEAPTNLNNIDTPLDLEISSDGRWVYVLASGFDTLNTTNNTGGQPSIVVYEAAKSDCWLRKRQEIKDGLPTIVETVNGVVGLAIYDYIGY